LIVQGSAAIDNLAMTRSFAIPATFRAASAAPASYYYPREAGTA
jgi:hypothetical protein